LIRKLSEAEVPTILTCFAYREPYHKEMEGMLATVRRHHPQWTIVVGRGPVPKRKRVTFEVETPFSKDYWTLPIHLPLDGSENDWRRITRMKAWWVAEVWKRHGTPIEDGGICRVVWLDADARLLAPLDIEIDTGTELVAGPWWESTKARYTEIPHYETITSGLLIFQGAPSGPTANLLRLWRETCLDEIETLGPPTVPWIDGDQEVLTPILREDAGYQLMKLDYERYCGEVSPEDGPKKGTLVDQWMMSRRMKLPETQDCEWPPPEHLRRTARL